MLGRCIGSWSSELYASCLSWLLPAVGSMSVSLSQALLPPWKQMLLSQPWSHVGREARAGAVLPGGLTAVPQLLVSCPSRVLFWPPRLSSCSSLQFPPVSRGRTHCGQSGVPWTVPSSNPVGHSVLWPAGLFLCCL